MQFIKWKNYNLDMLFAKFPFCEINSVFDKDVWKRNKDFSYFHLIMQLPYYLWTWNPQKAQLHCFRHILFIFYTFQCIWVPASSAPKPSDNIAMWLSKGTTRWYRAIWNVIRVCALVLEFCSGNTMFSIFLDLPLVRHQVKGR